MGNESTAGMPRSMDSAAVTAWSLAAAERTLRPEFTGSAREYFRIWIVNLFFSLITLGIYSAWAKVRKKRYFYGSTRLDGDSFDYFASPKAILKGRVLAFGVFAVYGIAGQLYPAAVYAFWAAGLLLLAPLVVRAIAFNARNSAWRGLRFDFTATTRQAFGVYLGTLLLVVVTLGLAYPLFEARYRSFVVRNHAFGTSRFGCELPARRFFGIYFRGGLILLAFAVPTGVLAGFALQRLQLPEALGWAAFLLPLLPLYLGYAVAYAYTQARTANLMWASAYGAGLRFSSTLEALKLARLYVGNLLAAAASAGLLIPWAAVRTLRYRLENFAVIVEGAPVHEASPALAPVGASGQELGDFFNVDLGI